VAKTATETAIVSCPIESTIGADNHAGGRTGTVGAIEPGDRRDDTVPTNPVDVSIIFSITVGRAIQITVGALDQRSERRITETRSVLESSDRRINHIRAHVERDEPE